MKYNLPCEIVKDLLPSYIDGITTDVSNKAIEEHLSECEKCEKILTQMKNEITLEKESEKFRTEKEIDYLKKVRLKNRIPLIILTSLLMLVIGILVYIIAPILEKTDVSLSEAQVNSLCEEFVKAECDDEIGLYGLPTESDASVKIYGVERDGEYGDIYGYVEYGTYVILKEKAYLLSGGMNPFKVKVKFVDDRIEIIKMYGDGVSETSIMEDFPLKYYILHRIYNTHDVKGESILGKVLNKKIAEKTGVEVEKEYVLELSDDGYYEIYDFIDDYELIEKGRIEN